LFLSKVTRRPFDEPRTLAQWSDALIHDPLPTGAVAVALMLGTGALLDVPVSGPLLGAAFCGTALVYLADRTLGCSPEDRTNQPARIEWARRHRAWIWGEVLLLTAGLAISVPLLQIKTLGLATLLGGVASLHVWVGLSGAGDAPAARLLKPLAVAGTWAGGAVVLPVLEAGAPTTVSVAGLAAYRFLFILPNVLLSDWGDRTGDIAAGLRPWTEHATARGVRGTASGLLGLALAGAMGASAVHPRPVLLWIDAVGPLLMLAAVWTADPTRPAHRFGLDLLVGWPAVTALAAWGLGV
jgi:4-hydroxybenzoate polyprenyltransferase